ncbi:chaperone protein dnaJ 20, chloroplastic-like [Mercurialis annua]|uniref:chaperone protein dnaJ 20, chloroplastic-like n=1 Tax=Mercurialis annua TaxID=3986 RepID=UPI00215F8074|nr:chaperone protein dnaJ 20, chloroplastic-like [Mercurialis annua]
MSTTTATISSGTCNSFLKPNFSTKTSSLHPCSHLSFTTHLPKSRFPLKTATIPSIKASATAVSDSIYVENSQSFYSLLGISETGTHAEIKKAYKQLARKYHPDVSPPGRKEEYTKRFIEVQEAYETLSDPERRALYDRDMSCIGNSGFNTVFSGGKRYRSGLYREDGLEWERRWQSQLEELIRKSNSNIDMGNMSWGAKMRSQRS